MGKDLCNISNIGKVYSLINKLVKMNILKSFINGDICHFGVASLIEEPRDLAKQLSKACYWKLFRNELVYLL